MAVLGLSGKSVQGTSGLISPPVVTSAGADPYPHFSPGRWRDYERPFSDCQYRIGHLFGTCSYRLRRAHPGLSFSPQRAHAPNVESAMLFGREHAPRQKFLHQEHTPR